MPSGGQNKISREELIAGLEDFAHELGEVPTRSEMNEDGPYSGSAYRRKFGSWNDTLRAVDLKLNHNHDKEKSEYRCEWCGTIEERHDSQVNGENYFCSRECKAEYQAENVVGEDHHQWNRVEFTCDFCGAIRFRKPSIVEDRERNFCDTTCMGRYRKQSGNPNWKGGIADDYGENWEKQRRKAIERDDGMCQRCGLSKEESTVKYNISLHVHHLIPRREFIEGNEFDYEEANRLENLTTLCPSCHRRWEDIPIRPVFESY